MAEQNLPAPLKRLKRIFKTVSETEGPRKADKLEAKERKKLLRPISASFSKWRRLQDDSKIDPSIM